MPEPEILQQLVRGWGNEAWSAATPLLSALHEWLSRTSGPIVECGSGLSSLLLATASVHTGRKVYSLEHDKDWASAIGRRMPARLKGYVEVCVAPLRNYGSFDWYALEGTPIPDSIGFVLCDGPPGATLGGRYGLAPMLGKKLSPGAIILLDDTQRPEERSIVSRWCEELRAAVVEDGGSFVALRVGALT